MEKKKVVIALGGNALGKDVEEQKEAVAKTAKVIVDLAQQGLDIIVTHGNGPQVGMIQNAMDNLVVTHENYKQVPLPTSVAMSRDISESIFRMQLSTSFTAVTLKEKYLQSFHK